MVELNKYLVKISHENKLFMERIFKHFYPINGIPRQGIVVNDNLYSNKNNNSD